MNRTNESIAIICIWKQSSRYKWLAYCTFPSSSQYDQLVLDLALLGEACRQLPDTCLIPQLPSPLGPMFCWCLTIPSLDKWTKENLPHGCIQQSFISLLPSLIFHDPISAILRKSFLLLKTSSALRKQWQGLEKNEYHSEHDLLPWEKTI